jgi:hypothetical protein
MQESFLHYIWQFQYFDRTALTTTGGEPVAVFHPGYRNSDAGPDFSQARIRIGNIEWIGNVEIHIYASGWKDHRHDQDPAYDNVILHVVWDEDVTIHRHDGSPMPTLRLNGKVSKRLLLQYKKLLADDRPIHCSHVIDEVDPVLVLSMKERALFSRLQKKAETILQMLDANKGDWEETCYQLLARNFGFRVNAEPFFLLATSLPYRIIRKHADKRLQVEALLFGQAGLLDREYVDPYYNLLKREYRLLVSKFDLARERVNRLQWKFLRLRPANFPTIRISQFASLLTSRKQIFSGIINATSYQELLRILGAEQSEYWKHHYLFTKFIKNEIASLGKMSIDNIIINSVIPLKVAFGKSKGEQYLVDQAVDILHEVHPEDNSVLKRWQALHVSCDNAFDSQALLELYNSYCQKKRCLECSIGSSLFTPG